MHGLSLWVKGGGWRGKNTGAGFLLGQLGMTFASCAQDVYQKSVERVTFDRVKTAFPHMILRSANPGARNWSGLSSGVHPRTCRRPESTQGWAFEVRGGGEYKTARFES